MRILECFHLPLEKVSTIVCSSYKCTWLFRNDRKFGLHWMGMGKMSECISQSIHTRKLCLLNDHIWSKMCGYDMSSLVLPVRSMISTFLMSPIFNNIYSGTRFLIWGAWNDVQKRVISCRWDPERPVFIKTFLCHNDNEKGNNFTKAQERAKKDVEWALKTLVDSKKPWRFLLMRLNF